MKNIRNIGVFAHVDAGKTTLTERMLQHAGAIRTVGFVDRGTAHTDRMDVERRRGISVYSTCAPVEWKGARINIIDTPGHMDFSAEVERSMWALDCAVMVVSAAEGIQPQTEALFHALSSRPMVMFVNKTDREGADVPGVIAAAKETLKDCFVDVASDEAMMEFIAEMLFSHGVLLQLDNFTWDWNRIRPIQQPQYAPQAPAAEAGQEMQNPEEWMGMAQ